MTSKKIDLSVVITTKNEEANISDCLLSCSFAKEIILVDDNSSDNTLEIAKNFNAKIFERSLDGDWGAQKSFGISKATCSWILLIDADERCSKELALEIENVVNNDKKAAYYIHRENKFRYFKATHGVLRTDRVKRLMPREGASVEGRVHEQYISSYPDDSLKGALYHYTYQDWDKYYAKLNKYANLVAIKNFEKGKRCNFFLDVILKPLWAFFKVYVINLGFLDGKIGFMLSANHYSYTLQKYVRLYTLHKKKGKL